ncbi:MAG TPA: 50S ribosomal protein L9 [Bacteroidales bacterium]|nr:50S ribosomal protein L9 [Bacteroidales bacterium]HPT02489.1 50S ribosomal protein L9 [Bacteroidales bacterium]
MEIILMKDVPTLGYAHDVITVKDGYGRNYLIPQGFAILATESSKKMNTEIIRQKSFKDQKANADASTLAKKLENITVKIGAKAATTGKIYGSVNAIQIADAIKEQFNYDIDRKKIYVDGESIKELGTYKAAIKLHKDIQVSINFEVVAE